MTDQPPVPPTPPTEPTPTTGGGANWQGVEPVVERPTEAMPPVAPPGPPPAPPTQPPPPPGGGANKGLVAAIVVVVLAILGVGGFLLLGGDDDGDGDDDRAPVERADDEGDDEDATTTTEAGEETTTTTEPDEDTATTTTVPPDGGSPAGFVEVTDDTGTLVVSVPDTWTDVDGRPQSSGDLNVQASTDVEAFRNLEASGVSFSLLSEANADPDTTLDFLTAGQVDSCDAQPREDYDDGVFRGRQQTLTDCGPDAFTLIVIVAGNEAGQSVEVSTLVMPPDPVEEIHAEIVRSFNVLQ